MPEIKEKGTYVVRIVNALFREMKKEEDPNAFVVSLKLETHDGYKGWYDLVFNHTVVKSGRNAGLTMADMSKNLLIELGIKDGYLGNLQKAIDAGTLEAEARFEWTEFREKETNEIKRILKCKYLNPPRKMQKLSEVNIDEILAKFNGTSDKKTEKQNKVDEGENPF